jgi:hypothetical protein
VQKEGALPLHLANIPRGKTPGGRRTDPLSQLGSPSQVNAHKRFSIEKAPNVLTIQLKRFEFGTFGGKIDRHVQFETTLDLSSYLSSSKGKHDTAPKTKYALTFESPTPYGLAYQPYPSQSRL